VQINLEEQQILELQATYSAEQVYGLALSKRVEAFGQMARLLQRPKPDDIEITTTQKRYEPFWFAAADAKYAYDRRHVYRVDVGREVRSVTLLGKDFEAADEDHARFFELPVLDHCLEEERRELLVDALHGGEASELRKYLRFPSSRVEDLAALQQGDAIVVVPTVLGSFVVRQLIASLIKSIHADTVHEERIDVQAITLYYRPVYAVEYFWKAKDRRQVIEFDALTGDVRSDAALIKKATARPLETDALFDIGTGRQKLQIEIDHARAAQQVAEITDSDYFRQLQEKVKGLRGS
jgi:hypothetical protein